MKASSFSSCLISSIRSNNIFNEQDTIEKSKTNMQHNYTNRIASARAKAKARMGIGYPIAAS